MTPTQKIKIISIAAQNDAENEQKIKANINNGKKENALKNDFLDALVDLVYAGKNEQKGIEK